MFKVLLAGGTGGLGSALAPFLEEYGYQLWLTGRSAFNTINFEQTLDAINEFQPNAVVNLVAYNRDSSILKLSPEEVDLQVQTNTKSLINLVQASARFWKDNQIEGKAFINISSVLATESVFGSSIYSATKAFADSFIRSAAKELTRYGMNFTGIQLGYFDAGLTYKIPTKLLDHIIEDLPAKRLGEPKELAQLINTIINTPYLSGSIIRMGGGK